MLAMRCLGVESWCLSLRLGTLCLVNVTGMCAFDSAMTMGVCRLVLLSCVVSTMMTADAAVIDDQAWNELELLDVCSGGELVSDTCALCPAVLPGVSMWRCCHDPRAFGECTVAVDNTAEDSDTSVDKRKTKFFLGKKRGVKYFLGKRSLGDGAAMQPIYDRQHLALALSRPQHTGVPDKRVKYFLG